MKQGAEWYKRIPQAFLDGVQGIGPEMIGTYSVILDLIYYRGGETRRDDHHLGGIMGCSTKKAKALTDRLIEIGKLDFDGVILTNSAATRGAKTRSELRDTRASAGRVGGVKSGQVRKNKDIDEANENQKRSREEKIREEKNPLTPKGDDEEEERARATIESLFVKVLSAAGINNSRMTTHWMPPAAEMHVNRWRDDLGVSEEMILDAVRESRKHHQEPPGGPKAFDRVMQRLSAEIRAGPMQPAQPATGPAINGGPHDRRTEKAERLQRIIRAAAEGSTGPDWRK